MKTCEQCRTEAPTDKWGKIRAHNKGWFFTKDGKAYCPKHNPEWVEAWRAKQ